LIGSDRRENTAEHCWHLAMMAIVLAEHSNEPVDVARVVRMVLVHDLVEIDAGDTYLYDIAGAAGKAEREKAAADRLFALLPAEQGAELRALWEEFEAASSPEARFATAIDRLMPQLHNYHTQGKSWQEHGISADSVLARNRCIADGSLRLWEFAQELVGDAVKRGFFSGSAEGGSWD
jgi:putative hydrolase of HD superfamily